MKRFFTFCCTLPLLALLTGFFRSTPTWEEVNATIDRQYPTIASIDVDTLKALLDAGQPPVLIDVRGKDEFAASQLPQASNISTASEVAYAKDTPIVVYCSVGIRSAAFAKALQEKGFTDVRNLRGSIFLWANRGYPLQRGEQRVRAVHPYDKNWGILLNPELHKYQPGTEELIVPGNRGVSQ